MLRPVADALDVVVDVAAADADADVAAAAAAAVAAAVASLLLSAAARFLPDRDCGLVGVVSDELDVEEDALASNDCCCCCC